MRSTTRSAIAVLCSLSIFCSSLVGCSVNESSSIDSQQEAVALVDDAAALTAIALVVGGALLITTAGIVIAQAYRSAGYEAQASAVDDTVSQYVTQPVRNGVRWLSDEYKKMAFLLHISPAVMFASIYQQTHVRIAESAPEAVLPLSLGKDLVKAQALSNAALNALFQFKVSQATHPINVSVKSFDDLNSSVRKELRTLGSNFAENTNAYWEAYFKLEQWLDAHLTASPTSLPKYQHSVDVQQNLDTTLAFDPVIRAFEGETGCQVLSGFSLSQVNDAGVTIHSLPTLCDITPMSPTETMAEVMIFVSGAESLVWANAFGMKNNTLQHRVFMSGDKHELVRATSTPLAAQSCSMTPMASATQTEETRKTSEPFGSPENKCTFMSGFFEAGSVLGWVATLGLGIQALRQALPNIALQFTKRFSALGLNWILSFFGKEIPVPCLDIDFAPLKRFTVYTAVTAFIFLVGQAVHAGNMENADCEWDTN